MHYERPLLPNDFSQRSLCVAAHFNLGTTRKDSRAGRIDRDRQIGFASVNVQCIVRFLSTHHAMSAAEIGLETPRIFIKSQLRGARMVLFPPASPTTADPACNFVSRIPPAR